MKIHFTKTFRQNITNLMRRCGYVKQQNRKTGEVSYVRRIGRSPYPHFHIYISQPKKDELILNLHLDQKKPSYGGVKAHSGEYDGAVVEREGERIKNILNNLR